MSSRDDARRRLSRLFRRRQVADLQTIQRALGTTSRTTVFRVLSEVGYRTSYSHAGRYYTLEETPDFDEQGLWAYDAALFSKYGTLRATIVRFVHGAPAGQTHAELRERLRLRVHDTLRELAKAREIGRVQLERLFVYVSVEQAVARAQVAERRRRLESRPSRPPLPSPTVIIEVLLDVIHSAQAWANPTAVAARLDTRGVA
ncbi:MAG: hypothetical protein ACE5G2_03655, partial [Candidatus Krumholzibacteriia bacterium]